MTLSIPGIKKILKCDAGTLATTPVNPFYTGITEKRKMEFKNYKAPKNSHGVELRNMKQGEISYPSLQPTLKRLKSCIDHANMNCDVQIVTEKQSTTADSEEVFKFTSSTFKLGLAFKYELSLEKIILTETLKGAANYQTVKALRDAGDSETEVVAAGVANEDVAEYHEPNIMAIESPIATSLGDPSEIDELKFIIESEGKDTGLGQATVEWLNIMLDITLRNASAAKVAAVMAKTMSDSLLLKTKNAGSYFTAFDFAAGSLIQNEDTDNNDESNVLKLKYGMKVRPYELSWNFGTSYGGAVGDNGLNGGTVKIGY